MSARSRAETAATAGALLLCGAFLASFLFGLRGRAPADAPPTAEPGAFVTPAPPIGRVEVLNASGRSGLARAATDRLRAGGFDVVYFGNAGSRADADSSVVIARAADAAVAQAAARRLGINRVRTEPDAALFLDATVVLGNDWVREQPQSQAEPGFWQRVAEWIRPGR